MTPTLVAVSHGTADPQGQGAIRRLVDAVADRLPHVDVRQAFVDVESPDLPSVLAEVDGPATVVPLLLAAGFHVHVDISTAVTDRIATGQPTTTAGTLGPDPALTGLLIDRLRSAGLDESCDAVVLAVAGSSDVRARLATDRAAAMLSTTLRRPVRVGHLGGAGNPIDRVVAEARRDALAGGRVVAASYLLAPGFFARRLEAAGSDLVTAPLSAGVRVDERLVDVVVRRYLEASHPSLARLG